MLKQADPVPRAEGPTAVSRGRFARFISAGAAFALAAAVFAFDTFSGYESAIAVLYALVLVLGAVAGGRLFVLAAAIVCGSLAIVSFLATHVGAIDAGNTGRLLVALVAIALTAALLLSRLSLHQTRSALADSEQNLRIMADTVPQILWQALPDGRIVYLSRRWTQMTGAPIADGLAADGLAFLDDFAVVHHRASLRHGRDGADVFEFTFGEETTFVAEFITDYEVGTDTLDLIDFGYSSAGDLTFTTAGSGDVAIQLTPSRFIVFEGHTDVAAIEADASTWNFV